MPPILTPRPEGGDGSAGGGGGEPGLVVAFADSSMYTYDDEPEVHRLTALAATRTHRDSFSFDSVLAAGDGVAFHFKAPAFSAGTLVVAVQATAVNAAGTQRLTAQAASVRTSGQDADMPFTTSTGAIGSDLSIGTSGELKSTAGGLFMVTISVTLTTDGLVAA